MDKKKLSPRVLYEYFSLLLEHSDILSFKRLQPQVERFRVERATRITGPILYSFNAAVSSRNSLRCVALRLCSRLLLLSSC